MENPLELLGNAFEGDIEIAGKRIPKVALVAGGGALIVLLILLSKRSGSGSVSSAGLSGFTGGAGGGDSGFSGGSDQATGDLLGGSLADISEQFSQQLADQSSSLTDLINQSTQANSDYLNSQLNGVYDQLANSGGGVAPVYSDQVMPLPVDYGSASFPVDSGVSSYPTQPIISTSILSKPENNSSPYVGNSGYNGANIKPSNPKPMGKKLPKLGAALTKPDSRKIGKLTSAPKQTFTPSAVLGFNKQTVVKPVVKPVTTAQGKKPNIPSPVPNKQTKPMVAQNVKPTATGKSVFSIPATIKNIVVSKPSPKPVTPAKKPTPVTPQKGGGYKPVASAKPISIPTYKPPVSANYAFVKPGLMYGSKINGTKKKGK